MNCHEAIRILLDSNHEGRTSALAYILNDTSCLVRVDQLARAIVSDLDNELSCPEARLYLADYYEQQHNQQSGLDQFIDIQNHLDRCPYCSNEYQLLEGTMAAWQADTLPVVESTPTFDLSFIQKPLPSMRSVDEIWEITNEMQREVRRLFQELQLRVSEKIGSIETLTSQLRPQQLSMRLRSGNDAEFAVMILPDEKAGIHFQVEAKPSQDDTAFITLKVFESESDDPIPDARITLSTVDDELVTESLTEADGNVDFQHIPIGRYRIQIQCDEEFWELPITITRIE